jgi:hypothetical protein
VGLWDEALRKTGDIPSVTWLATGASLSFSTGAPLWVGIHLREKTRDRLRSSVDIAKAGLTEGAVKVWRELQDELALLLPGVTENVNPETIFADPSHVQESAKRGIQILRRRDRLDHQFKLLLSACTAIEYTTIALTLSVVATTLAYAFATSHPGIWHWTLRSVFAVVIAGVGFMGWYGIFYTKIQNSIEFANPIERN